MWHAAQQQQQQQQRPAAGPNCQWPLLLHVHRLLPALTGSAERAPLLQPAGILLLLLARHQAGDGVL
jgi:hypothetical protein